MNEKIAHYREKMREYWSKADKSQKIVFIASLALLLLTVAIVVYSLSRTEYSMAFTDLHPNDAAAITSYLDAAGIKYKLSFDGKNIGVPRNQAAQVKVNVESQGILGSGSLGYGFFRDNKSSFGMTENEFSILHVDGIQGEIQQMLNSINGVSSSKVLIHMPKESVFLNRDALESTAAVMLTLRPGYRLEQAQIDTMYNLVAKTVPNLKIENITISNQNSELLPYSRSSDGFFSQASQVEQQFQIRKQFENDIQRNVTQLLSRIVGPDKVMVIVTSSLNFDQKNSLETLYTPVNTIDQTGIARSVQEIQRSYSGEGGAGPGGTAGTGPTDVPGYPAATSTGAFSSEDIQTIINYEVNQISREIVSSPYTVKDLTINVGIEPPNRDAAQLTDETKEAIQTILVNIVRASLADNGQVYNDNDLSKKVMVLAHNFASMDAGGARPSNLTYWLFGLGGAALALAAIGGYAVYRRRRNAAEALLALEDEAEPVQVELPSIDIDSVSSESQARKQLEALAKKKPDEFVNLLRTWLVDE